MKRHLIVCAAFAGAAALAACDSSQNKAPEDSPGQTEAVNSAQDAMGAAVGAAAGPMAAMTTDSFVSAAAISDMYEIEAGKVASTKAKSADVKAFGKMMVDQHTKSSAELKGMVGGAGVTLPTEMDERRKGFLDNLKAAGAGDFDRVYMDQQVAAHEEALALMRGYADGGDNAAIKAFAAKTAPVVDQHLTQARSLRDAAQGAMGTAAPGGGANATN
jgi:putative membrane protein